MKRPLLGLAAVFAAGIWLESRAGFGWETLVAVAAGWFVAFLILYPTRFSLAALLGLVITAGMVVQRQAAQRAWAAPVEILRAWRDQPVQLRGVIVTDPGARAPATAGPARRSFQLRCAAIRGEQAWQPVEARVQVFVSGAGTGPLRYGDEIECAAVLRAPPPARNPGTFDWGDWLARQGIYFTATVLPDAPCLVRARDRGNPLVAFSLRVRERFERALRLGLETEPAVAGVLAGMVIGEREAIPRDTYARFQETGVFHVFAINGLHVGVVLAVLLVVLRLCQVPRRWDGVAAIPLLVVYVLATGAHPGAIRALAMAVVWLVGRMLVRPADGLNNLAAAALVILAWEPLQLSDGGFILSFTVVTAIVLLTPAIEARLRGWVAADPLLPHRLLPRWRRAIERPLGKLIRLLSCSVAAWVGLVPLLAYYFHLFTPLSILANLLVLPLLGAVISLGMAAVLAYSVWPWLTLTFNNANFLLLSAMIRSMECLGKIPGGYCFVQEPPDWLIVAYYALLLWLVCPRLAWRWRLLTAAVATPALVAGLWLGRGPEDAAEITVLDVPEGSALFVNLPGEQQDVLIDGGDEPGGQRVVLPFLRAQGVDRLAAAVLTCADGAHAAGLCVVASEVPVAEALQANLPSRSKYHAQWLEQIRARKIPVRQLAAGDVVSFGRHLRVQVLYPPAGAAASRREDNVLVLRLEYGATRLLLMSAAGERVERRLLSAHSELTAQVLVRRAEEPAVTAEFLEAVQPESVVLITAARPDRGDAPARAAPTAEARRPVVYRTDELGAIRIRLTRRGYAIRGWAEGNDLGQ